VGRDSSVGIATRYWQDGLRIELRWGGEIFRTRLHRPGALPASYIMDTGSFTGLEWSGHMLTTPPPIYQSKAKFTLEQARKAQRGRSIALLFF